MPARVRRHGGHCKSSSTSTGRSTDPTASRGYDADRGGPGRVILKSISADDLARNRGAADHGVAGEGVIARARRLPGRIGGRCLVGPTPPLPHVSHPGWVTAGKRRQEVEPLYPSGLPLASGTSGGSAAGPRTEIASESSAGGRDG